MAKIEIIGLGALNMDYLYQVERILVDGEAVVKEPAQSPGGSAANTIHGLAKLGVKTSFIGAIGDDAEGKIIIRDFEKVGVDTSQIRVKPGGRTGSALCLSDQHSRAIYVNPGANSSLTIDDLDLNYINQAGLLHISSFADDRQFAVLLALTGKLKPSVKISFSPGALYSAKGLKTLSPILRKTQVLFINRDEIRQLTGQENIALGAKTCLEQGCQIVAVTLGQGINWGNILATSYVRDSNAEYAVESTTQHTGPIAETTGAGDAFACGFLYGLLKGKTMKECGQLGQIMAQLSVTRVGAREGLPTRIELNRRFQKLYHHEL